MNTNIDGNLSKILSNKYSPGMLATLKSFSIKLNNQIQTDLKLLQKEEFKKQERQLAIGFAILSPIKLQRIHGKIIQRLIYKQKIR